MPQAQALRAELGKDDWNAAANGLSWQENCLRAGEKAFLAAMARDLLGKRTESVSDKSQVEQLASERPS